MNRTDLLTELKHLRPYDESEADSIARTIAFIEAEPDAFHRTLKKGHVCGSALVVGYGGEKVLLMHHRTLGRWQQFGGHADGDENILNVAMREAEEESGLGGLTLLSDGIADVDVHMIPDRPEKGEPAHPHFDIRYILYTDETEFALGDKGVANLEWCDIGTALARADNPSVVRMLHKWQELRLDLKR